MNLDRLLVKAKRTDGEWVIGRYSQAKGWISKAQNKFYTVDLVITEINTYYNGGFDISKHTVNHDTICQCTGLHDDNGRLIFENDMLRCEIVNHEGILESYIVKVEWKDGCFYVKDIEDELSNLSKPLKLACQSYLVVIHNIHDKED